MRNRFTSQHFTDESILLGYERPTTPQSDDDSPQDPPEFLSKPRDLSDDDEDYSEQHVSAVKANYETRVERLLFENEDLQIIIRDAGKSHENGGSYIAYTIRTGVCISQPKEERSSHTQQDVEVRRRYSEFNSLRATLVILHPTLIIPPIPEKHSMADYAAKPTKAKEDTSIIDLRKRMLAVFLNRCKKMKEVREDGVWWRFLDPNSSWVRFPHTLMTSKLTIVPERSATLSASSIDTEKHLESTST